MFALVCFTQYGADFERRPVNSMNSTVNISNPAILLFINRLDRSKVFNTAFFVFFLKKKSPLFHPQEAVWCLFPVLCCCIADERSITQNDSRVNSASLAMKHESDSGSLPAFIAHYHLNLQFFTPSVLCLLF